MGQLLEEWRVKGRQCWLEDGWKKRREGKRDRGKWIYSSLLPWHCILSGTSHSETQSYLKCFKKYEKLLFERECFRWCQTRSFLFVLGCREKLFQFTSAVRHNVREWGWQWVMVRWRCSLGCLPRGGAWRGSAHAHPLGDRAQCRSTRPAPSPSSLPSVKHNERGRDHCLLRGRLTDQSSEGHDMMLMSYKDRIIHMILVFFFFNCRMNNRTIYATSCINLVWGWIRSAYKL